MKNYEPSDKFYTVLGVLAVIIGIIIYILTSGVLNGNKLDTNKEENNSSTDSPSLNDALTNQDTNLNEDNTSVDDKTTNESLDNNQITNGNISIKDTMTCTQTLNENAVNTNTNCVLEFENNLLLQQNCTTVMTSSSSTVLAAQFATTQIVLNSFNASTIDSSIMNSTLKYDEGKKITYTKFTDYKKIEENPEAILTDIKLKLSSKNTKEEVKNILAKEKYVCK